jgi:hypothetical protein
MSPPRDPDNAESTDFKLLLKVDGRYETANCTSAHDKLWIRLHARADDSVRRGHHGLALCVERARLAPYLRDDVREWEECHAPGELLRDARIYVVCAGLGGAAGSGPEAAFTSEAAARSYPPAQRFPAVYEVREMLVDAEAAASTPPSVRPLSRMNKAQLLDEARFAQLRVRHLWRERTQFLDILHSAAAERDELRRQLAKYREAKDTSSEES